MVYFAAMDNKNPTADAGNDRQLLRHTVATLAYRARKPLTDAPTNFSDFRISQDARTPGQILAHLGDLIDWALSQAKGKAEWHDSPVVPWKEGVGRFYKSLAALDAYLASSAPLGEKPEKIFQGAVADSLTHVGQLAILRRLAGAPIRGENYHKADIAPGRVGPDQPAPRREF